MPYRASLTAARPRLVAHAIVLVALAATWAIPHAPATAQHLRVTPGANTNRTPRAAVFGAARQGWGNDISWPQCDGSYPTGPHDIGVVGVTGGRPFTSNPCLASQFAWARTARMPGGAQLYVNLEIDGTSSGPHHCAADDHGCRAYDYGMTTMYDAISRAHAAGINAAFWWLDVELGNNWSDVHPEWNQATVQGAIDAVRARGAAVGIYSSANQWAQILPDSYQPGVPTWLAVVGNATMAPGLCAAQHSLTGGPVYLVQYDDQEFDKDHVCAAGATAFASSGNRQAT